MDLIKGLTEIGFTEYEAKVYLALLSDNPTTGYQISKKSGVPRSMVYEALSRLRARGAVLETIEGRATLYRPITPQSLLDRHEEKQQRLTASLRDNLQELYADTTEEYVWSTRGKPAVFTYAKQMLSKANTEAYLVLSDEGLGALAEDICCADQRGVAINTLLTGEGELTCGRIARHPPLESELQELTESLILVIDQREALIADLGQEASATITKNNNLVVIARQFVWMELFTQRIHKQLGKDLLTRLTPEDQRIFDSLVEKIGDKG